MLYNVLWYGVVREYEAISLSVYTDLFYEPQMLANLRNPHALYHVLAPVFYCKSISFSSIIISSISTSDDRGGGGGGGIKNKGLSKYINKSRN
ncbi:MAG: hypothetical protein R2750_11425 [Bacteroidales bacterium]